MISIIIPVYNQHEMTQECIEAISENNEEYEIIVIDNGSDEKFKNPDATVIRNNINKGFSVAINQGICWSVGQEILLLNNDVIMPSNALDRLSDWLNIYDIIGPVTNYCAGAQKVTLPIYNDRNELNERANEHYLKHIGESREVNWLIGFCMAFRKDVYDEIGSFDEIHWPCSGEEIDFCFRAREAGYKIGIAQDVYVHHFGSQTFKKMENEGQLNYQEICKRDSNHVASKWGADFWLNQLV